MAWQTILGVNDSFPTWKEIQTTHDIKTVFTTGDIPADKMEQFRKRQLKNLDYSDLELIVHVGGSKKFRYKKPNKKALP